MNYKLVFNADTGLFLLMFWCASWTGWFPTPENWGEKEEALEWLTKRMRSLRGCWNA